MIYGLIDRALLLSHPIFQQKNLEMLCDKGIIGQYPLKLIIEKINHRIKYIVKKNQSHKIERNTNESQRNLIVLPYIKNISEKINLSIDKSKYLIGYRILSKLTAFIKRHKDRNKFELNNNVVYKISCNNCNASCWSNEETIKNTY